MQYSVINYLYHLHPRTYSFYEWKFVSFDHLYQVTHSTNPKEMQIKTLYLTRMAKNKNNNVGEDVPSKGNWSSHPSYTTGGSANGTAS